MRKEYRQFNEALGQTGAGLRYEDVDHGSKLWNLIGRFFFFLIEPHHAYCFPEQLEQDFPYWKRLHGFWRTLPNFNPFTVSSEPGQDLSTEALSLVQRRGRNNSDDEDAADASGVVAAADDDDDDITQQSEVKTQVC